MTSLAFDSHVTAWRTWRHGQAQRFLHQLDPEAAAFTFQAFDDTPAKRNALARILHGDLERHAADLESLQQQRAGVFVTVNATDGKGRQSHNIERVRAVFVDLDGAPLKPVLEAGLAPHMVCESSPGRYHAYWLTDDCTFDQFEPVQRALAKRFGGDPSVHDLPRVMRLPGFRHFKRDAQTCKLLDGLGCNAPPYPINEVIKALHLDLSAPKKEPALPNGDGRKIEPGNRHAHLFASGRSMARRRLSRQAVHAALAAENQAHCNPPLPDNDIEYLAERSFTAKNGQAWHEHPPREAGGADDEAHQPDGWPDAIPFDEVRTPEIPARLLGGALGEFAAALANATETPVAMSVMTVLGVVSAALSKRFCVSPKLGWRESVNIYTAVALPPANMKSAVFKACTSPLVEWERQQAMLMEPEIKRLKSERKSQEKLIESARGKLSKQKDQNLLREQIREIADMEASLVTPPPLPQLFANNVTPEQMENAAHEQGGRFAVFSDEGGIMEVLSGLYSGGRANVDIILQGIDGGPVRVRRRERNFDLNPFLTFVLTVQPVIVQRMGDARAFVGRGLVERFMWVLPQSRLGYRSHDTAPVSAATAEAYRQVICRLLDIPAITVGGLEQSRVLTLHPDALGEWRAFQKAVEVQLRPSGKLAICQGWGGKICGFALRFAGLLHVAEHISDISHISAETMGRALELAALLIEHAIAAYGLMGIDPATQDARDCWGWIAAQRSATFKKGELTLHMRHRMNVGRIDLALKLLIGRGLIGPPQREPGSKSIHYPVRPELVAGGA